jgi:hypothetical protein
MVVPQTCVISKSHGPDPDLADPTATSFSAIKCMHYLSSEQKQQLERNMVIATAPVNRASVHDKATTEDRALLTSSVFHTGTSTPSQPSIFFAESVTQEAYL